MTAQTEPAKTEEELYHELLFYTLAHPDPAFIHQHAVDAWAAQHANASSKPISVVFSLLGLYLYIEKNITGKQIQKFHTQLAQRKRAWPQIPQPAHRGHITAAHVVAAAPGLERDRVLHDWCASVWECWKPNSEAIFTLARTELDIR